MKRDVLSVAMSVALVTVYSPAAFADSQLNFKIYSPGASSSTAAPKPADVQPAPDQPAPAEAKAPSSDDIVTASDHKPVESDSTAASDKPNDTATADSGAPMLQSETPAADAIPVQPASSVFDTTQAPAALNAAAPAPPAAPESASAPAPAATESASAPAPAAAPVIVPAVPVAPVTTALPATSTKNADIAGAANAAVDPGTTTAVDPGTAGAPAGNAAAAPANAQTAAASDAVDPASVGADGKQIASKTLQGYVHVVPTGTKIPIIMDTAVDSDTSQEGDEFEARTAEDLSIDGSVVVPAGSVIHGRIATLAAPKALLRNGSVALKFDTVTTPDNRQLPLTANLVARGGVVHAKRGMKDIAICTGIFAAPTVCGLAIGAVAGNSSSKLGIGGGALIGTGVGALVGVAILLARKGTRIEVRPGDELKIELAEDLRMPTM